MKNVMTWLCLAGFLTCLVGQSFAEDGKKPEKKKRPDLETVFKKLDKDSDGKLTKEEMMGKRKDDKAKERVEKLFARLDKDKDGALSLEEFKTRGGKKPKKKNDE